MESSNKNIHNAAEIEDGKLEQVVGGMRDPMINPESGQKAARKKTGLCRRCGKSRPVNSDGYCAACAK